MSVEVAYIITAFVAAVVIVTIWMAVQSHRSWARYRGQWAGLQKESNSDNPKTRRAAAKRALKLLKQGPMEKKRRLD